MSNRRITATFDKLRSEGRQALIPFVTAGYPFAAITPGLMHGMVEAGVDIIELGVPFSDPMADGPVIQKAGERAIANGVNLAKVLGYVREFPPEKPAHSRGADGLRQPRRALRPAAWRGGLCARCRSCRPGWHAGGRLPARRMPRLCRRPQSPRHGQSILLLAPTSSDARIQEIAQIASGYVYYVSLKGVTGSAALDTDDVARMLARIQQHVHIPVGVGFGIRDGQTAHTVAQMADAVIIGSRIIQLLEDQPARKCHPPGDRTSAWHPQSNGRITPPLASTRNCSGRWPLSLD